MSINIKSLCLLVILPLFVIIMSMTMGATNFISIPNLLHYSSSALNQYFLKNNNSIEQSNIETILWQVRLPRIVLTFMIGAALASSGNVLQAIFRNPIVDPFTLGISSGSAVGAALAMVVPFLSINLSAFVFGVSAVLLTYLISKTNVKSSLISMVLSGMIISGIFTAFLTLLQYISDPYKLQAIVQWTMGNLHTASWEKVEIAFYPIIIGLLVIILFRWKLNLLSLGDEEALAVGVKPGLLKVLLIGVATLITAACVAAVGVISLFGLIVPHISRMFFGPNNEKTIWANISIGGTLLLIIDDFSRTVMPFEIPVGVFTMLIGAPIFIYLMRKNAANWN
ncbi:iron ABC transporter permease [Chishuiella sp.]|uniref:FecCD family ABC transporter permease n=1 Tax=Chishuiella sp. TaxID=1969467 RepID=UPI0028AA0753|nr:iron ABC transporter permease [Chishuiella sp.]